MKLPCALHAANHLLVQELLLLAALCEGTTEPGVLCGPQLDTVTKLCTAAAHLAQSTMSYEEQCSYGPHTACRLRFPPLVESILQHRLHALQDWHRSDMRTNAATERAEDKPAAQSEMSTITEEEQKTRAEAAMKNATLPCTAPERLAALYAPPGLLPALPHYVHDTMHYDAAIAHIARLTRLLQPYGFQVALAGRLRRGAPLARRCEVILGLTSQATEHIHAMSAIPGEESTVNHEEEEEEEDITSLEEGHTALSTSHVVSPEHNVLSQPASSLQMREQTEWCSSAAVYAVTDPVTRRLAHVYNRAIEGLIRAGYVVAGQLPARAQWASRGLSDKAFTLRYYEQEELQHEQYELPVVAPRQVTDGQVLQHLQLHQVILHMAPSYAFHVRRLFLTGPAAFTAHVILRALEAGVELNMNGAFLVDHTSKNTPGSTPVGLTRGLHYITQTSAIHSDSSPAAAATRPAIMSHAAEAGQPPMRQRVRLQSEKDLFRLIGMPYVDPLNRGIYCQVHDLFSNE